GRAVARPRYHLAWQETLPAHSPAHARADPPGSTEAARRDPFFRRLPGDGRFKACVRSTIPAADSFLQNHSPVRHGRVPGEPATGVVGCAFAARCGLSCPLALITGWPATG